MSIFGDDEIDSKWKMSMKYYLWEILIQNQVEEPEDSDSELNEEEFEPEINATYPNEAYGDLMSLTLTNVDTLGKSQLHPIYLSIGNIKNWRRNKQDAKQLLGYLPILKSKDNTERKSETFKKAVRECFHRSLEKLLDPLLKLNKKGIDLTLNNELFWFLPQISIIISDWPEAATSFPLSNRLYEETLEEQCGKSLVDEIDHRLAKIPRFPGLKIFTNGNTNISQTNSR
ncbi:hypothetical protein GLOIN_2v1790920 [Rhizophagus clarus]|uniref:Uncharacterized protein n=1 Tax=Rhizophagus clarus TaxID=94130 RepID=A0A8H3LTT6_9GLOM|nr:hypothetical protein GLOIN_2v1790920 [Rhizophagus clarus]